MRHRSRHALGLILLAGLVLAATACGGGGQKAAVTTKATSTAQTTTASALSGLATAANCRQLADLATTFSKTASGTTSQDTKKVAQLLREFASKTPSDIRPDFEVVADAFSKIADVMGNIKPGATPDAAMLAKLATLSGEIDSAKLTTASEHISAWVQKNCHA